ncbi:MAG: hypothetical protein H0U86_09840 [Chloroflexi bacterium]|nr:hypothetical protein [Chloroflexota bacterium]
MIGWGIALIIIGAGSLLLPLLNYQFTLMELVDDYQPYAGIAVAVIGAVLVLLGMNRNRDAQAAASHVREPAPDADRPATSTDGADRRP